MEFLIKAGQLILSLSILIVLHEFGHYLPARWFKVKVEKFYLFFDYKFSLWKKKIGDTEWGIGWIPLGGYVKIAGMIDESMDKEQMNKPPQPWEFRAKPAWQRLIIMVGGVTVNLIVGILIYMMVLFVWGKDYMTNEDLKHGLQVHEHFEQFGFEDGDKILKINDQVPFSVDYIELMKEIALRDGRKIEVLHANGQKEVIQLPEDIDMTMFKEGAMLAFMPRTLAVVDTVLPEKNADQAGLKKGDIISTINQKNVTYWDEFKETIQNHKNETVDVVILRNNKAIDLKVKVDSTGKIGMRGIMFDTDDIRTKKFTLAESIQYGYKFGWQTLTDYVGQMKYLFTSKGASSLGGFGAIGGMFSPTWDWHSFWLNTAFLSLVLAFMNVLPIPALDGGHIMFTLYEMISGRKPNEKFMEYAQAAGMIFLLMLLLYANGNDLFRSLFGD
jgi:regulator of sigma E protease